MFSLAPTPFGKVPVEERDERPLFRRMREAAIGRVPSRAWQRNGVSIVDVPRDDDRMDIRLPADRRGVAELRGDETHRDRNILFRFAFIAGRAELREHGGCPQRSTPRAKILRAVLRPKSLVHVVVDVARGEIAPRTLRRAIPEETRTRSARLARDEPRQLATDDDLPLFLVPLSEVGEHDTFALDRNVGLSQRRYAICAVLTCIPLPPDATEALADQPEYGRGNRHAIQCPARGVRAEGLTHSRQRLGELSHSIVLPQIAPLDGARVIAVLLAPARVEAPRLNAGARARGHVHVAPGGRNAERIDARQSAPIAHQMPRLVRVAKAGVLGAESPKPPCRHAFGVVRQEQDRLN